MVGPRTKRGRVALGLALLGGVVLVVSGFASWTQPARIAWPSYTDGVPNVVVHPSDLSFRLGSAALGLVAVALVVRTRGQRAHWMTWLALLLLGGSGIALGLDGLRVVARHYAFGSRIANDMTIDGFRHGVLNYVELAGAALLCVSPLAALRASRQ